MFRRLIRGLAAVTVVLTFAMAAPQAAARPPAELEEASVPLGRTVLEIVVAWFRLAAPSSSGDDAGEADDDGGPAIDPNGIAAPPPPSTDTEGGPAIDPNG